VLQYRAWARATPAAHARFVAASRRIVDIFGSAPQDAMTEAYAQLRAMAMQAGLAYDTPGLLRIAVLAREYGGVAKPSGAGGGDVAVALFDDPEARAAFAGACAREGLTPISVEVAWPEYR
jgi:phosphomevalonate kinase